MRCPASPQDQQKRKAIQAEGTTYAKANLYSVIGKWQVVVVSGVRCSAMELPIEDLSVTGIAFPTRRGLQEASGRLKVLTQSTLLKKSHMLLVKLLQ